jgi:hypothetical protein
MFTRTFLSFSVTLKTRTFQVVPMKKIFPQPAKKAPVVPGASLAEIVIN